MGQLNPNIIVRNTEPRDFAAIERLCCAIYPDDEPWTPEQLASHRRVFPEGQFVAVDSSTGEIVGMAASLIIKWDDYSMHHDYREFTDNMMFTNHDPTGKTLYAAEVMSDPKRRGEGIGRKLYKARRQLARRLKLRRIRAGARLRGYSRYADQMSADTYVKRVVQGDIVDPTLSFQLRNGFRVLAVVSEYLSDDPESMGYAAVLEWINYKAARPKDYAGRPDSFLPPTRRRGAPHATGPHRREM